MIVYWLNFLVIWHKFSKSFRSKTLKPSASNPSCTFFFWKEFHVMKSPFSCQLLMKFYCSEYPIHINLRNPTCLNLSSRQYLIFAPLYFKNYYGRFSFNQCWCFPPQLLFWLKSSFEIYYLKVFDYMDEVELYRTYFQVFLKFVFKIIFCKNVNLNCLYCSFSFWLDIYNLLFSLPLLQYGSLFSDFWMHVITTFWIQMWINELIQLPSGAGTLHRWAWRCFSGSVPKDSYFLLIWFRCIHKHM